MGQNPKSPRLRQVSMEQKKHQTEFESYQFWISKSICILFNIKYSCIPQCFESIVILSESDTLKLVKTSHLPPPSVFAHACLNCLGHVEQMLMTVAIGDQQRGPFGQ